MARGILRLYVGECSLRSFSRRFEDFFAKYGQKEGIHSNKLWEAVRAQRVLLDPIGWFCTAMACKSLPVHLAPPPLRLLMVVCICHRVIDVHAAPPGLGRLHQKGRRP